jgi:hypothetical protein
VKKEQKMKTKGAKDKEYNGDTDAEEEEEI